MTALTSSPMPHSPVRTNPRLAGQRVLLVIVSIVSLFLGVVVLGAFTPDIPLLGVVGSVFSGLAPWFGLILLAAASAAVWLFLRRRGVWRAVVAVVAAAGLVCTIVITTQLVALGSPYGVTINPFTLPADAREPDATVTYGEHEGDPLELSVWTPATTPAGGAPIAFFVHGGGWVSGDAKLDLGGMLTKLSDSGWLAVSVEYTFATHTLHTSDFVEDQIGCAMAWTVAHADDYGADVDSFFAFGESAGGNLAINASYRANSGDLHCDQIAGMPTVDGVVALFPGVDLAALYNEPIAGGIIPGRTFAEQYIGGSPTDFPDQYTAVTSATHIAPTSPPTLILQGANDHLVQAPAVSAFVDQARAQDVDVTYIEVPFADHGFALLPLGAEIYTQIGTRWVHDHPAAP
jgi:acetyl esterase